MTHLLSIAEFVYGERIRREVFEPLVADLQKEIGANRSIVLRLRWCAALASTFAISIPRAAFDRLPATLIFDLTFRATVFGALAAFLQLLFARFAGGTASMPLSPASTAPFILLPVVWRVRVSNLPLHQRRLLAILLCVVTGCVTATAGETWPARLALVVMPALIGSAGWRQGSPVFYRNGNIVRQPWLQSVMIASVLQIYSWPVAITMGLAYNELWPHARLTTYIIGAACYVSIRRQQQQAQQGGEVAH